MAKQTERRDEVSEELEVDGHKLLIHAHEIGGAWSLCVINERGVASHWTDFFDSGEAALAEARRTIETEGVAEFVSIEGFEYLDQLNR